MKRDLISLMDFSQEEILYLLNMTSKIKAGKSQFAEYLKGKSIGLLFQKPSNRTRVSFEIAIYQLGGNCLYLSPGEINLGKRESTDDVDKTLSRYLDGIVARTVCHQDVMDLAQHASVPIINGLSDLFHPCQALADIFTVQERFKNLDKITLAYIGDGNNVCHSLMLACAKVGIRMNIATPKGYEPKDEVTTVAKKAANETGAKIKLMNSPVDAVKGASVIYSDVWVSMGQEEESAKRFRDFQGFQINGDLAKLANEDYIFMHCLPAHRGQEVTEEIIDGPHSVIFDQAENRLHIQKSILVFLIKK